MRSLLITLAACGSAAVPPAPAPPPAAPRAPAAVSCADAGVMLRGAVQDTKKAGPAKEAAIASACLFDKWPREVLDCVGTESDRRRCLDKLTAPQRFGLKKKLDTWAEAYAESLAATAEPVEDDDSEPAPPDLECDQGIGDVAKYSPVPTVAGEERDFSIKLRKHELTELCDEGWSNEAKVCFEGGTGPDICRKSLLDPTEQKAVTDKLAAVDALLAKIVAAKRRAAATYDCKQMVALHYRDAAWKGKAEPRKNPKATRADLIRQAKDRKQMIADSRAAMLNACTTEAWNATVRACHVVGGGDQCSHGGARSPRWGFPADGVIMKSGIAECDAYTTVHRALLACDKVPQVTRDAMKQSHDASLRTWLLLRPNQIATVTTSCRQMEQTMRQFAGSLGCKI